MWSTFAISCATVLAELYLPGIVALSTMNISWILKLCLAPVFSVSAFSISNMLLLVLGFQCSTITSNLVSLCISLVFTLCNKNIFAKSKTTEHLLEMQHKDDSRDLFALVLYIAIGLSAVYLFYIRQLDTPNSFFQGWDNTQHLSSIRNYADSGIWNPFFPSRYLPNEVSPYSADYTNPFYPSAWHILCASVVSLFETTAQFGINSVNSMLIGIVFPISIYALLRTISNNNFTVVLFGSLVSIGIPACPWDYIIYGPLYPNLFSTSLMPLAMVIFIMIGNRIVESKHYQLGVYFVVFIFSIFSVAAAHPNGIFSLIVFLAPYLSYSIIVYLRKSGRSTFFQFLCIALLWIAIAAFWILCYNLPFFHNTVSVIWPSIATLPQAIIDVLTLSIVNHPKQFFVAVLVFIGIIKLLTRESTRWLVISYVLTACTYILDAGTDIQLKSLITGFWYTDYHRTGALFGLTAIIAAAFGLAALNQFISEVVQPNRDIFTKSAFSRIMTILIYCISGIIIYIPSYNYFGLNNYTTAFGFQSKEFSNQNDDELVYYDILTNEELSFCTRIKNLIGENSTIINNPHDGSIFAYPALELPIYYRDCSIPNSPEESSASITIRTRLNEYANSKEVQDAVRDSGCQYVLQLDYGDNPDEFRINYVNYDATDWIGINSINEDTPGFTLVLKEKDMRLYYINPLE